ncbi:SEL1-like repeat protein [Paraburkholderia hiiakae]
MYSLAQCYDLGQGVPRDPVRATELYRIAADSADGFIKTDSVGRLRALG